MKSWIEYTTTEAASPKLWQLAGNKPFITAYAGVSYQNAINLNVMSRPIDYQNKEDEQLLLSAGEMTLKSRHNFAIEELNIDLDKFAYLVKGVALPVINFENWHLAVQPNSDNSATTYRFKADNFDINIPDKLIGAKVGIAINNLQSQGSIHNINMDVTYKAKADKISINYPLFDSNNSELLINDLTIEQAYQLKQSKYVDGSFKSTVGSLNYGKQNIGSGVLNMDFKGINFKEIDLYSYFDQDNLPNDNAKPAPLIFNIDKLNWHNSEGDINLVINLALTGVNSFDADVGMDNIESMKFKFDAPSRVIAKILAQWNNPSQDGVISRQVDNMDSYVQMMGQLFFNHSDMILFEKDGVKGFFTDVNYQKTAPNVYINGNKMDKRSFLNNFDDLEEDIDDDMEDDF
ncbi:DUF945 family protein [Orbaceae bacterium ESL0721]|nr:DUF945 family protein [Orbaceae bacterium ESL0721]